MNWPAILTPLMAPNLGFRGSDEPGQSTEGGFHIRLQNEPIRYVHKMHWHDTPSVRELHAQEHGLGAWPDQGAVFLNAADQLHDRQLRQANGSSMDHF